MPQKLKCDLALEMDFFLLSMLPQKPSFFVPFAITMKSVAHILRSLEFQTIKAHLKVETKTLSFAVSKPMELFGRNTFVRTACYIELFET